MKPSQPTPSLAGETPKQSLASMRNELNQIRSFWTLCNLLGDKLELNSPYMVDTVILKEKTILDYIQEKSIKLTESLESRIAVEEKLPYKEQLIPFNELGEVP